MTTNPRSMAFHPDAASPAEAIAFIVETHRMDGITTEHARELLLRITRTTGANVNDALHAIGAPRVRSNGTEVR